VGLDGQGSGQGSAGLRRLAPDRAAERQRSCPHRPRSDKTAPMGALVVKWACWIDPVTCSLGPPGWGRDCGCGFPRRCRFVPSRGRGQAGAPVAPRLQARARTNELDAGKRRPMIGSEGRLPGVWLCGGRWAGLPRSRVGGRSGLTCTHPAPAVRWRAAMTVASGDRAAQSGHRARRGRLMRFCGLARGLATLPVCHGAPVGGADAVVMAGGLAARSASVSRCQARVRSLRAIAVVAIFLPRLRAMI